MTLPFYAEPVEIYEANNEQATDVSFVHQSTSAWPSDGGHIVLEGRGVDIYSLVNAINLVSHIKIQLPYGEFIYEIVKAEIIRDAPVQYITTLGKEALVLQLTDETYLSHKLIIIASEQSNNSGHLR